MIRFIKGELQDISPDSVVIENGGIGYVIYVSASLLDRLPPIGSQIKLYTYMYVREDTLSLYGFLSKDDLTVFQLLIGVSGIGPKGALGILATVTPDDLRFAILADDAKTIAKSPGIGAKTAKKLIIELKDKLKLEDVFESKSEHSDEDVLPGGKMDIHGEAVQALCALGYSSADALRAVKQVEITEDMTVEALLKASLRKI